MTLAVISRSPALAYALQGDEEVLDLRPRDLRDPIREGLRGLVIDLADAAEAASVLYVVRRIGIEAPAVLVAGDGPTWADILRLRLPDTTVLPAPVTPASIIAALPTQRTGDDARSRPHEEDGDDPWAWAREEVTAPEPEAPAPVVDEPTEVQPVVDGAEPEPDPQPDPRPEPEPPSEIEHPQAPQDDDEGQHQVAPAASGRTGHVAPRRQWGQPAHRNHHRGAHERRPRRGDIELLPLRDRAPAARSASPAAHRNGTLATRPDRLDVEPAADLARRVHELLWRSDELFGPADTAAGLAAHALERTPGDACAVLLPDRSTWRVAAGVGLRPLEHRLQLPIEHWLVREVASSGNAVLVQDTDIARRALAGAPLAARVHLAAAPVPGTGVFVVVARDDPSTPFDEAALGRLVDATTEAIPAVSAALELRQLARTLAQFLDEDRSS